MSPLVTGNENVKPRFWGSLWRHTGVILVGIGVFHILLFTILGYVPTLEILRAGVFNAIGDDFGRGMLWYGGWFAGGLMILLGLLAHSWVRATARPLPRYFGIFMVVMGAILILLQPASGGILILLVGVIALTGHPAARQDPRQPTYGLG